MARKPCSEVSYHRIPRYHDRKAKTPAFPQPCLEYRARPCVSLGGHWSTPNNRLLIVLHRECIQMSFKRDIMARLVDGESWSAGILVLLMWSCWENEVPLNFIQFWRTVFEAGKFQDGKCISCLCSADMLSFRILRLQWVNGIFCSENVLLFWKSTFGSKGSRDMKSMRRSLQIKQDTK